MSARFMNRDGKSSAGTMLFVLALHAVVGALVLHSSRRVAMREAQPIKISFLAERAAPVELPLTPTVPSIAAPQPTWMPAPEVRIEQHDAAPIRASDALEAAITTPSTPQHNTPPLVSEVEYLQQPVLSYPAQSRRLREQGTVVLRVLIDEAGHAAQIDVYRSSGFPRLDEAARRAVRDAQFKPYTSQGRVQAAVVMIPLEFSLRA